MKVTKKSAASDVKAVTRGRQTQKTKYYLTLEDLVRSTHVNFAERTELGWIARRKKKYATHRLHYTVVSGQLCDKPYAESL